MFMIFIVFMGSKSFEIGHRVKWPVGHFTCFGIFFEQIDSEFSIVQCTHRNSNSFVRKLKVLSSLLEFDD